VIGKTEEAYFRKSMRGGHQRPQDQLHQLRRWLQPAEDGRTGPQAGGERRGPADFNSLAPPNSAIQKYMNTKEVPQLFVATGATKWNDPRISHGPMGC